MLGGLLFGIATFRAGILPRWAAGLLAVGAALAPVAALLPHELQRLVAVPMGFALAWLGYALWSERREQAAEPVPGRASPQLRQTGSRVRSLETAWRGQAATLAACLIVTTRMVIDAAPPGPLVFGTRGETHTALRTSVQGAEHESECLR